MRGLVLSSRSRGKSRWIPILGGEKEGLPSPTRVPPPRASTAAPSALWYAHVRAMRPHSDILVHVPLLRADVVDYIAECPDALERIPPVLTSHVGDVSRA